MIWSYVVAWVIIPCLVFFALTLVRNGRRQSKRNQFEEWVKTHYVEVSGQGERLVTFYLEDLYRSDNSARDHIVQVQGNGKVYTAITRKRIPVERGK